MGLTIQQGLNATNRVASTTDNAAARFDGTTGLIQNSALAIDDTGHISSFGGNIKFPATQAASADANTLDDYEEGTYTPTLRFGGGSTGMTYSAQVGVYTKIGRLVHCEQRITLTAKGSSTGTAAISGLPYSIASVNGAAGGFYANMSTWAAWFAYNVSATVMNLSLYGAATVNVATHSNFNNTSDLVLVFDYNAA